MDTVMPIVASVFGVLSSALLGIILNKVSGIESHLEQLNGKFYTHSLQTEIHEAGFARVNEQIKNLLQTVRVAHERLDRMESKV